MRTPIMAMSMAYNTFIKLPWATSFTISPFVTYTINFEFLLLKSFVLIWVEIGLVILQNILFNIVNVFSLFC